MQNAGASGFEIVNGSRGNAVAMTGTGNADFGILVDTMSTCNYEDGTTLITGTAVGDDTQISGVTKTYAALGAVGFTDPVTLCRLNPV